MIQLICSYESFYIQCCKHQGVVAPSQKYPQIRSIETKGRSWHDTLLTVWLIDDPYIQSIHEHFLCFMQVFTSLNMSPSLHLSRWTLTETGVCWPVAGTSSTPTELHRTDGPAACRSSNSGARPGRGRSNMASAGCLLPSPAQVRLSHISLLHDWMSPKCNSNEDEGVIATDCLWHVFKGIIRHFQKYTDLA